MQKCLNQHHLNIKEIPTNERERERERGEKAVRDEDLGEYRLTRIEYSLQSIIFAGITR